MKLSDFLTIIRMMVPSATTQTVPNSTLILLINKGVSEVNIGANALVGEKYFDAVADQSKYDVSSLIPDFVHEGDSGLWYNNGSVTSPNYKQLDSVSREYLNKKVPNWVNQDSSNPVYFVVETGSLRVHSAPTDDLTNGFWFPAYIKRPVDMSTGDHYPFTGSSTELSNLQPLDDAIIDYVRFMLQHAVGSTQKGIITRQEFQATLRSQKRKINLRPAYRAYTRYRSNIG